MAKKDVEKYYWSMQEQYLSMTKMLTEVQKAINEGFLPEERLAEVKRNIATLRNNYERLGYIMFLLNKPNRNSKKHKEEFQNRKYYKSMETCKCTQDAVEEENNDILKYFKTLLIEIESKKEDKQ